MARAFARVRRGRRKDVANGVVTVDLERERKVIEEDRRTNQAAIDSANREAERLREATIRSTDMIERARHGD